jgi:DNA ligase (NAD+)
LVSEPADLFKLKPGDFLTLEGFAELSSRKLVDEIQAHRRAQLDWFINALGIRHVGEETARDLAKHFGTFDKFVEATAEDLMTVEGIGDIVAESIASWKEDKRAQERLKHLLKEVEVGHVARSTKHGTLEGTTWVLTGTLTSLSRDEAKEKIRQLGGEVSETVSRNTSFVVVGAEPGSKADKAKKLGVTMLDEKEFLKKVGK